MPNLVLETVCSASINDKAGVTVLCGSYSMFPILQLQPRDRERGREVSHHGVKTQRPRLVSQSLLHLALGVTPLLPQLSLVIISLVIISLVIIFSSHHLSLGVTPFLPVITSLILPHIPMVSIDRQMEKGGTGKAR